MDAIYCNPTNSAPWFVGPDCAPGGCAAGVAADKQCCRCHTPPPIPPAPCGNCWGQPGTRIEDRFNSLDPAWIQSAACIDAGICEWKADGNLFLDVPGWNQFQPMGLTQNVGGMVDVILDVVFVRILAGIGGVPITVEVALSPPATLGLRAIVEHSVSPDAALQYGHAPNGWVTLPGRWRLPVGVRYSYIQDRICVAVNEVPQVDTLAQHQTFNGNVTIAVYDADYFQQQRAVALDSLCVRSLNEAAGVATLTPRARKWARGLARN